MKETDLNAENLERRLTGQPFRRLPPEWREAILDMARAAARRRAAAADLRPAAWWRTVLWPHPVAWAGVAAAWMAILILNHAGRWEPMIQPAAVRSPSPGLVLALIEHRRQLNELLEVPAAESVPAPAPGRSAPRGALTRTNRLV